MDGLTDELTDELTDGRGVTPLLAGRVPHRRLLELSAASDGATDGRRPLMPGTRVWVLDARRRPGDGSHLEAPARRAVTAAARRAGVIGVVVGSCGPWGYAVAKAAAAQGLEATVVVPDRAIEQQARICALGAQVIRHGVTYEHVLAAARARERSSRPGVQAAGPEGWEVVEGVRAAATAAVRWWSPRPAPAGLWVPMGSGATVAGLGRAVLDAGWSTRVFGVTTQENSILTSWPGAHHPIPARMRRPAAVDQPLARAVAGFGYAAISVLAGTHGRPVRVDDAGLTTARELLARQGTTASTAGAAGLAGLLRAGARGGLARGVHVAVVTG